MDINITVIGGANIDICTKSKNKIVSYDSNIGEVEFALGGVGRNIAECLSLFGANVSLMTAIGNDSFGRVVSDNAREQGIQLVLEPFEDAKTGIYVSINDSDGSFVVGINDMSVSSKLTPQIIKENSNSLMFSDYIVLEANLNEDTIQKICSFDIPLIADCVSTLKCRRLEKYLDKLWLLKANKGEAGTLSGIMDTNSDEKEIIKGLVKKGLKRGIVTLGKDGASAFEKKDKSIEYYYVSNLPGVIPEKNTNGCGDALLAGFLMNITRKKGIEESLIMGQAAAYLNSCSFSSVNKNMSFTQLKETVVKFKESALIRKEEISL